MALTALMRALQMSCEHVQQQIFTIILIICFQSSHVLAHPVSCCCLCRISLSLLFHSIRTTKVCPHLRACIDQRWAGVPVSSALNRTELSNRLRRLVSVLEVLSRKAAIVLDVLSLHVNLNITLHMHHVSLR